MVSHKHFVANLWRWSAGVPEVDYAPIAHDAQWSPEFERLMRNRLIVGAYRYGSLSATCKPSYDRVESCLKQLAQYRETGNLELLVDVANLCLLEFVESKHPNRHFHSVDDGEHVTAA